MLTIELVLRMTPPPCARMILTAGWMALNSAFTLRFIIPAKSSGW